jgi:nicotinate-nucleotide adenylyltransferase
MRRIGIFSGTFDPVHKGHIAFAMLALEKAELDMVYFAPEVRPRRKPQVTHYAHRVAMLRLATRPYKQLAVLELPDRYFSAVTTLPKLEQKFPGSRLVMLLGSDLFEHLPSWSKVDRLLAKVGLVVGARGNYEVAQALAQLPGLPAQPMEFHVLDSVERQTSSAKIRKTLIIGKPSRELVPSVAKYVRDHWLYHDLTKAKKTK